MSAIESVRACLVEFGYRFAEVKDGTEFRFEIATEVGRQFRSQLIVHAEEGMVRLYVYLDDLQYLPGRRGWVVEAVARLNECVVLGHFDFRWDAGTVQYRTALDGRRTQVEPANIEDLLNSAAFPLRLWAHVERQLPKRKVTPRDAVEAAQIACQVAESELSNDSVRRGLLELV
jgi:hypothetical protein